MKIVVNIHTSNKFSLIIVGQIKKNKHFLEKTIDKWE